MYVVQHKNMMQEQDFLCLTDGKEKYNKALMILAHFFWLLFIISWIQHLIYIY